MDGSLRVRDAVRFAAGYALLFSLFFSPVPLRGELLAPGDGFVFNLAAYEAPPALWSDRVLAGYPLHADPQSLTFAPAARLCRLLGLSFNVYVVAAFVVASSGTALLALGLSGSVAGGWAAGLVMGLGGFFTAHLGHSNMIHAGALLPWMLLCVDGCRRGGPSPWPLALACATAACAFSGHPQVLVWSVAVALAYAIAVRPRSPRAAAAVILGLALAAPLLIPALKLTTWSVRSHLDFGRFATPALGPARLPALLFPFALGGAPDTESHGFMGLLPLGLAALGLAGARRAPHVAFLGALGAVAGMLSLGRATPLARLCWYLPVANLFRAPARHLLELTLAVALLAAIGIARLERGAAPGLARAAVLALVGAGLLIFGIRLALGYTEPVSPAGVLLPLFLAMPGLVLVGVRSRWRSVLVVAAVLLELAPVAWRCEWRTRTVRADDVERPAYLERYAAELAASRERILTFSGELVVPEEPGGNLGLLWELPNAAGYNPLLLGRYSTLMRLQPTGRPSPMVLSERDAALDLASVRYLFIGDADRPLLSPFVRARMTAGSRVAGMWWSECELLEPIAPGDAFALELAAPVKATHLGIATWLPEPVVEGTVVATGRVTAADGAEALFEVRAGRDTDARCAEGATATVFPGAARTPCAEASRYLEVVPLAGRSRVTRVELAGRGPGTLWLDRATLADRARGRSMPLLPEMDAGFPSRWELVEEREHLAVYRNTRALPRARLVRRAVRAPRLEAGRTVALSRLPDGEPYDPRSCALVEDDVGPFDGGPPGEARVVLSDGGRVEVEVHAPADGLLVVSDPYFPGWVATLDGAPVRIHRADYAFRGVVVPRGRHTVAFRYDAPLVRLGVAVGAMGLAAAAALCRLGPRSTTR